MLVQTKESDTRRDKIGLSVASSEVSAIDDDDRYGKRARSSYKYYDQAMKWKY